MDGLKTTRVLVVDDELEEARPFIEAPCQTQYRVYLFFRHGCGYTTPRRWQVDRNPVGGA